MVGKSIIFLLCVAFISTFQESKNPKLQIGYYATKDFKYYLILKQDSTFEYVYRRENPIEITHGKWNIENKYLILNSVADTNGIAKYPKKTYVMFLKKKFIIKNKRLIDSDSTNKKYKFYIRKFHE